MSLRSLVQAAQVQQVGAAIVAAAEHQISELEQLIRRLGGKKSNLDTVIGSERLEAREKIERSAKQSIYRGMSNLFGVQSALSLTSYFVYPSDNPLRCNELACYGNQQMHRLRPDLTTMVGGRKLMGSGEQAAGLALAREVLHRATVDDSGYSIALKPFCSEPFPQIEVQQFGDKFLYTLPGQGGGDLQELSLVFASIESEASARVANDRETSALFMFVPRNPAQELLLDVFVHRDIWQGIEPRLEVTRADRILAVEDRLELDLLDFTEQIQSLGTGDPGVPSRVFPRYLELVSMIRQQMSWTADEFRLFRLQVKYPVVGLSYSMLFDLPQSL